MIYTTTLEAAKEPKTYHALKKEIENIFGQRILTSRECLMLAEEIYNKTSALINFNTLRRFFGLVKARYPASNATINILSAYCGFNSFDDLIKSKKVQAQTDESGNDGNLLSYLTMVFKNTHIKENNDETFNSFVKITIEHLHENDCLMKSLQKEIVKTKNGRRFYFERNVNYDKLTSFYGDGLAEYINESTGDDEKIFGLSVLCLRDWLANDEKSLKRNFNKMQTLELPQSAPLHIWARYMCAAMLYAQSYNVDTEKLLYEAYMFHESIKAKNTTVKVSQSFEYIYANTLVLTSNYNHALYYINYVLENYADVYAPEDCHSLQKLLLLKAIALSKQKNMVEAKKIYNLLKPSKFYFFSAKFDTALYLMLTKEINKGNKETNAQLKRIIDETGFFKLQSIFLNKRSYCI